MLKIAKPLSRFICSSKAFLFRKVEFPLIDRSVNSYRIKNGFDGILPELGEELKSESVKDLYMESGGGEPLLLHYPNYSVCMHKRYRLPIFSACNVLSFGNDGLHKNEERMPWKRDKRIHYSCQSSEVLYKNNFNDLSDIEKQYWEELYNIEDFLDYNLGDAHGHMTKRTDAIDKNANFKIRMMQSKETFFLTNSCLQWETFNGGIWKNDVEKESKKFLKPFGGGHIITGPVLLDPSEVWVARVDQYGELFIPNHFWKIAINGNNECMCWFGAQTIGEMNTSKISLSELENITGLSFPGIVNH